jgi:hypothetical protein
MIHERLRDTLDRTRSLTLACVEDFTDQELRRGPEWGVNCAAWILGHLAYSQLRLGLAIPFAVAIDSTLDRDRFGRGSQPIDPAEYPGIETLRHALADAHGRVFAMLDLVGEDDLAARPANLLASFPDLATRADVLIQCALHESIHTGQLLWLRKKLGKDAPAQFRGPAPASDPHAAGHPARQQPMKVVRARFMNG